MAIDSLPRLSQTKCAPGAVDHVVVAAGEVAPVDALHLDHPRAEVGEIAGGQWGSDSLLDGDDGNAVEWKTHDDFFWAWRTRAPPMMRRWISLVPSYKRSSRTSR